MCNYYYWVEKEREKASERETQRDRETERERDRERERGKTEYLCWDICR